ncbi:hypothetical protein EP51_24280 [Rhodococcus opacus]|uniref:Uncharacterized protein n=1 Tax=Rhodococcus opacus TaxID=37919 RepID=A0A076EW90_RHOOP|nr:hypothetical protein EP51_24280 [Rhodococcus opacus]
MGWIDPWCVPRIVASARRSKCNGTVCAVDGHRAAAAYADRTVVVPADHLAARDNPRGGSSIITGVA